MNTSQVPNPQHCHGGEPGVLKPHHVECVAVRGLAVSEVVERTLNGLTTADQRIAANEELIRELKDQLAKADANCKLLREQPRARALSSFKARFVYNVLCTCT